MERRTSMTISAFYFNANECMNCKACMAACNDVHNISPELHLRKVLQAEVGQWEYQNGIPCASRIFSYSISVSCNHCNNPLCATACPQKAITKDQANGIVFINQDLCIGCGKCAKACPYHAPVVDRRVKKALKCDTCFDLRKNNDLPACVASCSMRCLSFYSGENYEDIINQILYDHECIDSSSLVFPGQNALLPNPDPTEPNLFITPHRNDNGLTSDDIVSHDN